MESLDQERFIKENFKIIKSKQNDVFQVQNIYNQKLQQIIIWDENIIKNTNFLEIQKKLEHPYFNQIQQILKINEEKYIIIEEFIQDELHQHLYSLQQNKQGKLQIIQQIGQAIKYLNMMGISLEGSLEVNSIQINLQENTIKLDVGSLIKKGLKIVQEQNQLDIKKYLVIIYQIYFENMQIQNLDEISEENLDKFDQKVLNIIKYDQNQIEFILANILELISNCKQQDNEQEKNQNLIEQQDQDLNLNFDITQLFLSIDLSGFTGKDYIQISTNMIEELQVSKYDMSKAENEQDKLNILNQAEQILNKIILRSYFDIQCRLGISRQKCLQQGDRDKYQEQLNSLIEVLKWITGDLKHKAVEMLDLENKLKANQYKNFGIEFIERTNTLLLSADQTLIAYFKADEELLMKTQIPLWLNRDYLIKISRFYKVSVQKLLSGQCDFTNSNIMLEEALKIEDEIWQIFEVQGVELTKGIIDFQLESEFFL